YEKEHGDVMAFPPRKRNRPLISGRMILRIGISGIVMAAGVLTVFAFSVPDIFDMSAEQATHARTMAFCVLAFFQIWNVQNSRSLERSIIFNLPFFKGHKLDRISPPKNLPLLAVMLLAVGLQVAAVELPFMNFFMKTQPLSFEQWGSVMLVTFSIIIIVEFLKYIQAHSNEKKRIKGTIDMFQI
ncbi:MAG: cation-translocating P-type ATPase C-terminal domain-containing protein, partial [Ignavibacteria bacterium]|nr:cation-translocating P-type ATPase C-terminal domain-containing protein [Ignavibacteria bacterium]